MKRHESARRLGACLAIGCASVAQGVAAQSGRTSQGGDAPAFVTNEPPAPSPVPSVSTEITSIAIIDALKMFPGPIIELHISNIHRREAYYHNSLVSKVATAVIAGLGPRGYALALRAMIEMIDT